MAICEHCKAEYEARRADSRYCSPRCRTAAHRVTDNVTVSDVTDNPVTDNCVTDNDVPGVTDNRPAQHGDVITLSDGQQFTRDTSARDQLNHWARTDNGTRGILGVLNGQYEVIR